MITFKRFLAEEVITSKRKSLLHLQSMKPIEFVKWVQSLHNDFNGVLDDLSVSLKVDGLGARFGKDSSGEFFFEGSRTGPIFKSNAFSDHARSRGHEGEMLARAEHYDQMFEVLKKSALVKLLPNDTKVVCEIFYNPMGTDHGDQIVFVTVKYDKSKLGSLMTIVPISILKASTGEEHSDAEQITSKILKASTSEIKVVDANLKVGRIDIRGTTKSVLKFGDQEFTLMKSLKGADKEQKAALLGIVQQSKDALAELLLTHPSIIGKDKLGKDIEGLVFTAGDQPVKVTTQEFKDSKKKS